MHYEQVVTRSRVAALGSAGLAVTDSVLAPSTGMANGGPGGEMLMQQSTHKQYFLVTSIHHMLFVLQQNNEKQNKAKPRW